MAEPFYRLWGVDRSADGRDEREPNSPSAAWRTFPRAVVRCLPRTTPATWTGCRHCSPRVSGAAGCTS